MYQPGVAPTGERSAARRAARTESLTASGTGPGGALAQTASVRFSESHVARQAAHPSMCPCSSAQSRGSSSPSSCRENAVSTSGHPAARGGRGVAERGGELLANGGAGTMEAALDRVDAGARDLRDLRRGQSLDVAQDQDLA